MSYQVMNQWQAIRSDLRTLGINYNSGRGRNNTYGNGGYGNAMLSVARNYARPKDCPSLY